MRERATLIWARLWESSVGSSWSRLGMDGIQFDAISYEKVSWPERRFKEDAIKGILCNLGGDKAPELTCIGVAQMA